MSYFHPSVGNPRFPYKSYFSPIANQVTPEEYEYTIKSENLWTVRSFKDNANLNYVDMVAIGTTNQSYYRYFINYEGGNSELSMMLTKTGAGRDSAELWIGGDGGGKWYAGDGSMGGRISSRTSPTTSFGFVDGEADVFTIDNSNLETLRTTSDNRVGILTSSPEFDLHVNGDVGITDGNIYTSKVLPIPRSESTFMYFGPSSNEISFSTSNNTRLIIKSTGRVGIGVDNPLVELDVDGDIANETLVIGDKRIYDRTNASTFTIYYEGKYEIYTNGSPRITVLENGNVGVVTPNPLYSLHVSGDISNDTLVLSSENLYNKDHPTSYISFLNGDYRFFGGGAPRMIILSSGNVGVGTGAPLRKFHVNGDIRTDKMLIEDYAITSLDQTGVTLGNVDKDTRLVITGTKIEGIYNNFSRLLINSTSSILNYLDNKIVFNSSGAEIFHDNEVRFSANAVSTLFKYDENGFIITGDNIYTIIDGENVVTIDGQGNVGIGTETPQYKLHVNGSFNASSLETESLNATTINTTFINSSGGSPGLVILDGGAGENAAVNMSTLNLSILEIATIKSKQGNDAIIIESDGTVKIESMKLGDVESLTGTTAFSIFDDGTVVMPNLRVGDVETVDGGGVTLDVVKLNRIESLNGQSFIEMGSTGTVTVGDEIKVPRIESLNGQSYLSMGSDGVVSTVAMNFTFRLKTPVITSPTGNDCILISNNGLARIDDLRTDTINISSSSSKITLKSTGRVGINTTSPSGTLDVNGSLYADSANVSGTVTSNRVITPEVFTNELYVDTIYNSSGDEDALIEFFEDSIYIGPNPPTEGIGNVLVVNGSGFFTYLSTPSMTANGLFAINIGAQKLLIEEVSAVDDLYFKAGTISAYPSRLDGKFYAAGFIVTSDIRTKNNIEDLSEDRCIDVIKSLEPKKYSMKVNPESESWGLIAQDIEEIIPEAVTKHEGFIYIRKSYRIHSHTARIVYLELDFDIDVGEFIGTDVGEFKLVSREGSLCGFDRTNIPCEDDNIVIEYAKRKDIHSVDMNYALMATLSVVKNLLRRVEALENKENS